jgi:hypothetical protein
MARHSPPNCIELRWMQLRRRQKPKHGSSPHKVFDALFAGLAFPNLTQTRRSRQRFVAQSHCFGTGEWPAGKPTAVSTSTRCPGG